MAQIIIATLPYFTVIGAFAYFFFYQGLHWTWRTATAQNEHMACGLSPSAAELDFVARTLAATIQACAVEYSEAGLTNAARMLRSVYRRAFNGSGA